MPVIMGKHENEKECALNFKVGGLYALEYDTPKVVYEETLKKKMHIYLGVSQNNSTVQVT